MAQVAQMAAMARMAAMAKVNSSSRRGASGRAILAAALAMAGAMAPGATNSIAIGYARYTLGATRLDVEDVADPANPLPVCHFDFGDFEADSLARTNGQLVALGEGGSVAFDISDIFAPLVASISITNGTGPAASTTAPGPEPGTSLCCDELGVFFRRRAPSGEFFDDAPFHTANATNAVMAPVDAAFTGNGLILVACYADGVRIFRMVGDGPPEAVTHCLVDGNATAVAPFPGGFGVALDTRGYATYGLDDLGLVTLRRQWPLETGRAVSAEFDGTNLLFDCQEGGVRSVAP